MGSISLSRGNKKNQQNKSAYKNAIYNPREVWCQRPATLQEPRVCTGWHRPQGQQGTAPYLRHWEKQPEAKEKTPAEVPWWHQAPAFHCCRYLRVFWDGLEAQPQVWFGEAAPPGMMPPPQAALQLVTPCAKPVPVTAHPDKHRIPGRIYCPTHNARLCR